MPSACQDSNAFPPEYVFNAYLHSLTLTNPNLTLDATNKTLSVGPAPNQSRTVSVVSGSALRFTPYIASFVGPGLLSACIVSNFPVPSDPVEHVRIAIQERVLTTQKVLFIVPQPGDDEEITGEAGISAKRHDPTLQFEQLTAPSTLQLEPGPELPQRPGAGLPLLLKICSATAAKGYNLQEVLRVGKLVVKNLLSVGSNLRSDLNHGGPNFDRLVEPNASVRIRNMVSRMLDPKLRHPEFVEVNSNEVVLLISGHSRMTMLEMGAITSEVVQQLEHWHVRPVRIYTESVSVQSVLGRDGIRNRDFAVTILNVCNTDIGGPSMIQLLDAPVEAAGWTAFVKDTSWEAKNTRQWERNAQWTTPSGLRCDPQPIWRAAVNGSRAIVAFAKRNKLAGGYPYETWYGDSAASSGQNSHAQDIWHSAKGKFWFSFKLEKLTDAICGAGATEALAALPTLSDDIFILMNGMMSAAAPALDNPFGALVTIFLIALGQSFRTQTETADEINIGVWLYALEDAFQELPQYAYHRPAMAPTLNVLYEFMRTLHSTGDVSKAAEAAEKSTEAATNIGARLLCAFFAGLAGPVNGKAEQGFNGERVTEVDEGKRDHRRSGKEGEAECKRSSIDAGTAREGKIEEESESLYEGYSRLREAGQSKHESTVGEMAAEADAEGHAGKGFQAEILHQSLLEEGSPVRRPEEGEQTKTSTQKKPREISEGATASPELLVSKTAGYARLSSVNPSLAAAVSPTTREASSKEVKLVTTEMGRVEPGRLPDDSRDAIAETLQIKHTDFDVAMEAIRSRESFPLPTREMEETTLLDMVQQQIETLGEASMEGAAAEKDTDEEEYELI